MATVGCTSSCRLLYVTDLSGRRYLVDTGSEASLLPPSPDSVPITDPPMRLRAANGTQIAIFETGRRLTVDLGLGRTYPFDFIVAAVPTPILGADFLRQHGLVPDLQGNQLIDGRTFLASRNSSHKPLDRHPDIAHVSKDSDSPSPDGHQFADIRRSPQFQQLCVPPVGFPSVKTPGVVHRIFTKGNPVYCRPRRLLPEKSAAAKRELEQLLERGILEPSSSEWASPIHLVAKPGDVGYRMVGCYERLNAITVPDRYPVPDIQTFTDQLDGATIFSTVDLARAFAQIPVREIDRPKTAITTQHGLFQYTRMPFGLCNAAQTFQRLIDTVLRGMPRVFAYIDDILVFSPDPATHRDDLQELFDRLSAHGLVVRPEKCIFGQQKVRFLGLEVSPTGIRPTPDKVADLLHMPPPRNLTELRRFIGMINFYHRFVPRLASVLRPLHDLVNRGRREFHWSSEHAAAYDNAKNGLASASLLAFPRCDAVTQVAADASEEAVGAVIQQFQSGRWVPIAYHSKKLSASQLKWSTGDKELFALFSAVKRFQHLLEGRPNLQLLTDHKPLVFAFTSATRRSARVQRQLAFLSEFTTDIRHVHGQDNVVPDYLSRPPTDSDADVSVAAISGVSQNCLDLKRLAEDQRDAPDISELAASPSLQIQRRPLPGTSESILVDVSTGVDRPLVPESMQRLVYDQLHNLHHPSARVTRRMVSDRFVFKRMSSKIAAWAKACLRCQQSKVSRHQKTPLVRPPTPTQRFAAVHVDIVGPLPESEGYRYLFTIVDRFTRYPEAIPLREATAASSARALLTWISHFGMCTRITSDRGKQFVSELWKELWSLLGVTHTTACAYMPQQNGLVERMHRQLKASLTAVLEGRNDWPTALPMVLLGMRAAFKPDLGTSAGQLVFGEAMRLPGAYFDQQSHPDTPASEVARAISQVIGKLRPTPTAWHHRHDNDRPFVSPSLATATHVFVRVDCHKPPLQPPYKGPYLVLDRGAKAYTLDIDGRTDLVAIDRLKPSFSERQQPATVLDPAVNQSPPADKEQRPPHDQQHRVTRYGRRVRQTDRFSSTPL